MKGFCSVYSTLIYDVYLSPGFMFFDFLAASLLPADVSFTYAWLPEDECHFITRTFFNITEVILSLPEGIEPPT